LLSKSAPKFLINIYHHRTWRSPRLQRRRPAKRRRRRRKKRRRKMKKMRTISPALSQMTARRR